MRTLRGCGPVTCPCEEVMSHNVVVVNTGTWPAWTCWTHKSPSIAESFLWLVVESEVRQL